MVNQERRPPPVSRRKKNEAKYIVPLLSPTVPMESLSHLPRGHPAVMMKQGYSLTLGTHIDKLYSIAPSLNKSPIFQRDPADRSRPRRPDAGDRVVRFVFREFIAWRGDAETSADATETDSIASFPQDPWVHGVGMLHQILRALRRRQAGYVALPSRCGFGLSAPFHGVVHQHPGWPCRDR